MIARTLPRCAESKSKAGAFARPRFGPRALRRIAPAALVLAWAFLGRSVLADEAGGDWGKPLGAAYVGPDVQMRAVAPPVPLEAEELHTIQMFQRTAPSVVYIVNSALMRQLFTRNVYEVPQGAGSGFVWNQDGYIVTNYHVVRDADSLTVVLADQSEHVARVVGVDPDHDLAVVQIRIVNGKLIPIAIGSSRDLKVGQKALAIGNPFGLDHTLTTGVVSALNRSIQSMTNRTIEGAIQIDAAINPGNSGGPLLDSGGRLIGINTMIVSPSGASSGIGFAIPIDTINQIVPQLIQYGSVLHAGLGVSLLPDRMAQRLGVDGVILGKVGAGGPAERAGLQGVTQPRIGPARMGDVIVAFDGERVHTAVDVQRLLERRKAGDQVSLDVMRDGRTRKVMITLESIH